MERSNVDETKDPDEETLHTWEDMVIEVVHELQDGASADVPDDLVEEIGELIPELEAMRAAG